MTPLLELTGSDSLARLGAVARRELGARTCGRRPGVAAALFGAEPLRVKLAEIETAVHAQKTEALAGLIAAAEDASIGTQEAIAKAPLA